MDKLKITSARLQALTLLLFALTPVAVAMTAWTGAWAELLNIPHSVQLDTTRISGGAMLAVLALGFIKPAVYMTAFFLVHKLLGLYRVGIIFSAENVAAIRKIGWALVSIDIAGMLQSILTGPVLSFFDITSRHISVRLELGYLVVGLFIVLIAYVMEIGRELKEQDSLVI